MHDHGHRPYAATAAFNMRPDGVAEPEDISLLSAVNAILRRRWLVLGTAVALASLIVVIGLVRPRTYTAQALFMPQSRKAATSLSGLASQFGLSLPTDDGGESPQFYVDLLRSRDILRATVNTRYEFATDTGPWRATLVDFYDPDARTPELRREEALRRLRDDVSTSISQKTGVVTMAVALSNAALSEQVASRMIRLVNEFNLQRRRSHAAEERRFADQRLAEVTRDLRAAEHRLEAFLQSNREYAGAPSLRFEQERLAADVSLQRELFLTLSQAREQAKMDEVRDTPVITVIESPEAPVRPDPRGLLGKAILGFIGGAVLGILLAFAREYFAASGTGGSKEYEEFATLRRDTIGDLTHPWRPLRRLLARRQVVG
jgi:uncharacterized protein involved in exopolysaccharide biosynthesis